MVTILILIDGFLQCFNSNGDILDDKSHNPYFNRWFSAMRKNHGEKYHMYIVTILILIDGFLQFSIQYVVGLIRCVTILILIDGFLQ